MSDSEIMLILGLGALILVIGSAVIDAIYGP